MTERSAYIDNLKGILISLVVIGHLISYMEISGSQIPNVISNYIYLFHMPFFIFLSGLFVARTYEKNAWEGQIASASTFLILYIFFRLASAIVNYLCGKSVDLNLFYSSTGAWYLLALSGFVAISPIISKLKFRFAMLIALALSVANTLCNNDVSFLASSRFFTYLPWFVLGYSVTGKRVIEWRSKLRDSPVNIEISISLLALTLLTIIGISAYLIYPYKISGLIRQLSTGQHTITDIKWVFGLKDASMLVLLAIIRIAHYVPVGIVCLCVAILCPKGSTPLTRWGRNSLQVYIVHLLILYAINGTIGLSKLLSSIGINGAIWEIAFPIAGGLALTALLAIPDFPNKWVARLKCTISSTLIAKN